ncbi:hypothetical protein PG993_007076 [Apiospora rasikravindrae]|uniref:Uncharacterized protein n=1 Tax=Apiospora rasikravindrae TaxID=990691 RepID=A0ABR1SWG8_9PEZI
MRFFSGIIPVVTAAVTNATLGALPEAPLPGYGVEPMQWAVEVAPGQTEVLNGTVQQVHEQALHINPEFRLEPQPRYLQNQTQTQAQKREERILCFPPYVVNGWDEGIAYLRRLPGSPTAGPGPGNCSRVSCSNDCAIWWCNDNTTPLTIENYAMIATAAQAILDKCQMQSTAGTFYADGQNFLPGNWNTILRNDTC